MIFVRAITSFIALLLFGIPAAYAQPSETRNTGINSATGAMQDVNGDGWDDSITATSGLFFVFSGGPYIPRDPSLGVEDVVITGGAAGIEV